MMHRLNNTYLPSICAHQDISRKFVSQNTKKYTKEIPYLYWTTGNIKSESWKLKLHSRMHKPVPQSLVPHYNHANYSLCLRRLHSRDRNPPYQAGERPPTIPESGEEKRCHPHSIGTDRNRICSYPQEVGSRETTTESCLVGCERSVTSP